MTKVGSNCYSLPLTDPEKTEVAAGLADAKEIHVCCCSFKKHVFSSQLTGFSKTWRGDVWLMSPLTPTETSSSCHLTKLAETDLMKETVQSPSKFCPPFTNAFYGLFTRCEINPKHSGNVLSVLEYLSMKHKLHFLWTSKSEVRKMFCFLCGLLCFLTSDITC